MPITLSATGPDVEYFTHASPSVIRRYLALEVQAEDDLEAARMAGDRMRDTKRDAIAAEREVLDLERADQRGEMVHNVYSPDDGNTVLIRDAKRLEVAERRRDHQIERLHVDVARHKALSAKAEVSGRVRSAVRQYLTDTVGTKLYDIKPELPVEGDKEALEQVRATLTDLKKQRRAIEKGPGTVAEAKAAMRRAVEQLVQTPDVATLFAPDPFMRWPKWALPEGLGINTGFLPSKVDGAALMGWLLQDKLIAALDRLIEANAPADTMTREERQLKLIELDRQLLELGYREQALIDALAGQASPRADADPRCLLMLAANSPPPKGTS